MNRYQRFVRTFASHITVRLPKPKVGEKLPAPESVKAALDTAYSLLESSYLPDVRAACVFLWTLTTGTRRAETAALEIDRMGLDRPQIIDGHAIYEAVLPHSKTADPYTDTVDYDEEMHSILKRWLSLRPAHDSSGKRYPHLFVGCGACGRKKTCRCVACRKHGKPSGIATIRHDFRRISEAAGVWITPHQVRHHFGQRITDCSNLEVAKQRLRHNHITTTALYYAHQDKTRRKKSVYKANPRDLDDT